MSTWPEPVIPVQTLSDMSTNPNQYIKPLQDRQRTLPSNHGDHGLDPITTIPVLNLSHIFSDDPSLRQDVMDSVNKAWSEPSVDDEGFKGDFFKLPKELKQLHANLPVTYEGYGSRHGVDKEAMLDWCDYYFLHFYPYAVRDSTKWPTLPTSCRLVLAEYCEALVALSQKSMKAFSSNLCLEEGHLLEAFGDKSACLRANFYPKCQWPDLTLGLSPHSDPGGLMLLLADQNVASLQVRKGDEWVTVKPLPKAFIVNLGDQIQILSNGLYRSVEQRATVNSEYRISTCILL